MSSAALRQFLATLGKWGILDLLHLNTSLELQGQPFCSRDWPQNLDRPRDDFENFEICSSDTGSSKVVMQVGVLHWSHDVGCKSKDYVNMGVARFVKAPKRHGDA